MCTNPQLGRSERVVPTDAMPPALAQDGGTGWRLGTLVWVNRQLSLMKCRPEAPDLAGSESAPHAMSPLGDGYAVVRKAESTEFAAL